MSHSSCTTHHFQAQAFNSQSRLRCAGIRELSNDSRWHAGGRFFFLLVHMVDGVGTMRRLADTQDDGVTSGCATLTETRSSLRWPLRSERCAHRAGEPSACEWRQEDVLFGPLRKDPTSSRLRSWHSCLCTLQRALVSQRRQKPQYSSAAASTSLLLSVTTGPMVRISVLPRYLYVRRGSACPLLCRSPAHPLHQHVSRTRCRL